MTILFNTFVLTLYFCCYSLIHSLLASLAVKTWLQAQLGATLLRGYRLGYNIFAFITLLPFFALQVYLPNPLLYHLSTPWRWFCLLGQLIAVSGAAITLWQTGASHFLGLAQLMQPTATASTPLQIQGFYRWVRHPLYFFSLLFIWLSPTMSLNQFIGYVLFSSYFYIGSIYEERKLVAEFGQVYLTYQQHVPRLIPLPRQWV